MNRNTPFDMTFDVDGEKIRVVGSVTPYYPAVMYLRNGDPGHPAEGGEIEDVRMWRDGVEIEYDEDLFESIESDIYERLDDMRADAYDTRHED